MIRALGLALALGAAAPADAKFDPVEFFRGHSEGRGELRILLQSPVRVDVKSEGRTEKDGSLLLIQRVHQQGEEARPHQRQFASASRCHFSSSAGRSLSSM